MNRIRCAKCHALLHSRRRHDFITCDCGAVSIDGGDDYLRMSGWPRDIILVDDDGKETPLKAAMAKQEDKP